MRLKKKGARRGEENETGTVKRRCEGSGSVEAFQNFVKGEIWIVVVVFLGRAFLVPDTRVEMPVVPDVTEGARYLRPSAQMV